MVDVEGSADGGRKVRQRGLQLARQRDLTVAADAGAQAVKLRCQRDLGCAIDPTGFTFGAKLAAGVVATGAAQAELADAHARAIDAGAQSAIAELKAIDHGAQRQVIGLQVATELRGRTAAADGHVGGQRAAQPPTRRRQHRPSAKARKLRFQLAVEWCVCGPSPAGDCRPVLHAWLARLGRGGAPELCAKLSLSHAGACAVPAQLGGQRSAFAALAGGEVEARLTNAGRHTCLRTFSAFSQHAEVTAAA